MLHVCDPAPFPLADQTEGVLNRPYCVAALAALRHTKWFKVCKMLNKSTHYLILQSCTR